jgi:glutathione S-transferase
MSGSTSTLRTSPTGSRPSRRYFDVFDRIGDLGFFAGLPKVVGWRKALSVRPSVAGAVVPDYAERLMRFLEKHDGVILKQTPRAG